MKSKMRNEFRVLVVADRSISRPSWTHRGFETSSDEKATHCGHFGTDSATPLIGEEDRHGG
jgi:hypothetical protein